MSVPVFGIGERFVNAVVEIFVVGKNDMPADIVELEVASVIGFGVAWFEAVENGKTYEAFGSDVCGSEAAWGFVGVDDHP